jgi:ATP-dependent DNA helicase RecG
MIADPESSLSSIPGLGKRQADRLRHLGIETLSDLLRHYPNRWIDRTVIRTMGSLTDQDVMPEETEEDGRFRRREVTVLGRVVGCRVLGPPWRRGGRGARFQRLQVVLQDDTGHVTLVFFGGSWRETHFVIHAPILASGPVTRFNRGLQFTNPDYEILDAEEEAALHTGVHVPVYPLTRGLSERMLREWMRHALGVVGPGLSDPIPARLRARYRLLPLLDALRKIHFPKSREEIVSARRRLAFEELFIDQMVVQAVRLRRETGKVSPIVPGGGPIHRRIRAALPFTLTEDQGRALEEILSDMKRSRPMNRLLQGDVGSGKTVVALLAAAAAADADLQTAFLVPTEILAEQHLRTLRAHGAALGLDPRILVGGLSRPAQKEVLRTLADGSTALVVGTHALFQDRVRFRNLGLVVVDEQHRFGVEERVAMSEKGAAPHVLVMSATPIPRSIALVQYADLDLSVIAHRPEGRGRVVTRVTSDEKRDKVHAFLAERLSEGRQAFVIYPLVEESERSDLQAATTMARELAAREGFRGFQVDLLHGQMPSEEKDRVMQGFVRGETSILVATTVVEVGIDVPNATVLVIEHPERYGLSQLHQLRGRVGRGPERSYCVLVAADGLPEETRERLHRFAETEDGFELARLDLLLRGQGELLGTRQSGPPGFKLADPLRDVKMTEAARREAEALLAGGFASGELGPELEPLRRLVETKLERLGALIEVG